MEIAKMRLGDRQCIQIYGGGLNGCGFVYRLCWRNSVRNATKKKLTYERVAACSASAPHTIPSPFSLLVLVFALQFKSQMDEARDFGKEGASAAADPNTALKL
jgi:hypothetical protein